MISAKNPLKWVISQLAYSSLLGFAMKWKFTYKEFSLLLGILVAIIIVLTIWLKPASAESGNLTIKYVPRISKPVAKTVAKVVFEIIDHSSR